MSFILIRKESFEIQQSQSDRYIYIHDTNDNHIGTFCVSKYIFIKSNQ